MYIKPETLKNIIIMLLVIALTLCLVSMFSKSKSEGFYGKCATCAQKLADLTRSSSATCRSFLPPGSMRSSCEASNTYSDTQRAEYIKNLDTYLSAEPNMTEMCQKNAQLSVCQ